MKKKALPFPKADKKVNYFLHPPAKPAAPTMEQLSRMLREITPHFVQAGFTSFVFAGYRRVGEDESKAVYKGDVEVPMYYHHPGDLASAAALLHWAAKHAEDRLVDGVIREHQQKQAAPAAAVETKKE
jgi:hypothetical protein